MVFCSSSENFLVLEVGRENYLVIKVLRKRVLQRNFKTQSAILAETILRNVSHDHGGHP